MKRLCWMSLVLFALFAFAEGCGDPAGTKEKSATDGGGTDSQVQADATRDSATGTDASPDRGGSPEPRTPDAAGPEPRTEPRPEPSAPDARSEPATPEKPAERGAPDTTDKGTRTCEEVRKEYGDLVKANEGCKRDGDCHVVNGHCSFGLGGCWYTSNKSLTQGQLDALGKEFRGLKCGGGVCDCAQPPKEVMCQEGKCAPKKTLSCDDIKKQYNDLVQKSLSCKQDGDCHVVNGHCAIGLGGCWYIANKSLTQSQLDAISKQWSGQSCRGGVCKCAPPPTSIQCSSGMCAKK